MARPWSTHERPPLRRGLSHSQSRSPSPDPALARFLAQQARPISPESEAFRQQRIASGGVSHVKSRHQRDKENAEKRKREEEESAARAYDDFAADMQGHHRGEHSRDLQQMSFVRAGGTSYEAKHGHKDEGSSTRSSSALPRRVLTESISPSAAFEGTQLDQGGSLRQSSKVGPARRGGKMQDFLSELQRDQAIREERLRSQVSSSASLSSLLAQEARLSRPRDEDDLDSSNICILNLPAQISEVSMGHHFSAYGDVASVKIMWPRTEDASIAAASGLAVRVTRHEGATGFVNFMRRSDAQFARQEVDGSLWRGSTLRTGWGKSLPKPARPLFAHATHARREKDSNSGARQSRTTKDDRRTKPRSSRSPDLRGHRHDRHRHVACDGHALHSDDTSFDDEGYASLYSSDTEEASEEEHMRARSQDRRVDVLGRAAGRRLDAMLRSLTLRRERIALVMLFAIEHASCAGPITDRLIDSLMLSGTPLPRKLARLYAVSDVLHNSSASASSAWRYRSLLETRLDSVFTHWGDVGRSFPGRIKREACKDMARNLLDVWDTWLVFDSSRLARWRSLVESGSEKVEAAARHEVSRAHADDDIDGRDGERPLLVGQGSKSDGEDIDGEDIDGEDIDGEDIDGEDIDGEDIDGEDIDGEDIDGKEM